MLLIVVHEDHRKYGGSCMTRKIATGCFAALLGLAVSAGAQTPTTPQTPPSQPPSSPASPAPATPSPYPSGQTPTASASDRGEKGNTKLTGCVQAGTTAGAFELTNVKKGAGAMASSSTPSSTDPATPSASASPSSADRQTVKLVASPSVDLTAHVGHTVELTGSWNKSASSDSTAATPSASMSSAKEFNVTAAKMVSSTCSAGTN